MKAEQPRNLGDMHLAVVEVTNRQIAPQVLKYLTVCVRCRSREGEMGRSLAWSASDTSSLSSQLIKVGRVERNTQQLQIREELVLVIDQVFEVPEHQ